MSYDPHDGAVAERLGAQIQESRTLTLKLWLLKLGPAIFTVKSTSCLGPTRKTLVEEI